MKTIETGMFLDDFEAEAKTHVDTIESAFLAANSLADDPKMINSIFRTAHSLKGTAGFFSLHKIVAVAHELESVLSQIRDGHRQISDELVDIVLQSVDCLKDLIDNLQNDDGIVTDGIIASLKKYSTPSAPVKKEEVTIPFDLNCADTEKALKNSLRHGHKIYYVCIGFNRSLVKYYKHPKGLIDSIMSVGAIVEALVSGQDASGSGGYGRRSSDVSGDGAGGANGGAGEGAGGGAGDAGEGGGVGGSGACGANGDASDRAGGGGVGGDSSGNGNNAGSGKVGVSLKGHDADMTAGIVDALTGRDTSTLELLVTSVLEFELFSIATEIDKKHIHHLPGGTLFHTEGGSGSALALKPSEGSGSTGEIAGESSGARAGESAGKSVSDSSISVRGGAIGSAATAAEPLEAGAVQSATQSTAFALPYEKKTATHDSSYFIRLDISVINSLLDLANEMILTRNHLVSTMANHKKEIAGIAPVLYDISRLTSEIQERVMLTRMQPISVVFSKFPRIIRDTAKLLGKDIAVEIIRDDVTLDKYLLESLTDPITQLVKNSADHGLESAEVRAAAGKPPKGIITLDAYMRDGSAIIEVADDGAGIDKEALKRRALEQGISTAEQLAVMPDNDVFSLMFEQGFSTAKQVTNLSGRGVGMDIVKTNIANLGGSIEIESEIGKGSTMRLKMPLTLSVIRTLIVTIDAITYAVPELNVERIVRISGDSASKRIEKINTSLILSLNGRIIPIVTMGEISAKAKGTAAISAYEALEVRRQAGIVKCLVLRANNKNFALLIDDALETEQILVKPLPVFLKNCPCYTNVTVLGNGKAVPILNAEGIMRFMGVESIERDALAQLAPEQETGTGDNGPETGEKQILVFVCSGPEYFAIETKDISRIEVIDPGNIQDIGSARYINIAGVTVQVIRPEDYSPVSKSDYDEEKLYILTLKKCAAPIGLLVRRVLDKVEDVFTLSDSQLHSEFVSGTCAFNEKILIFLNLTAITGAVSGASSAVSSEPVPRVISEVSSEVISSPITTTDSEPVSTEPVTVATTKAVSRKKKR